MKQNSNRKTGKSPVSKKVDVKASVKKTSLTLPRMLASNHNEILLRK